jgi:hypothetical protein
MLTISSANITELLEIKLYLKGGEGSMAILELFGPDADNNGVADELETIRNSGWLISEAKSSFHVDASAMGSAQEPRIYVYDLNNSRPIFDYAIDALQVQILKREK